MICAVDVGAGLVEDVDGSEGEIWEVEEGLRIGFGIRGRV